MNTTDEMKQRDAAVAELVDELDEVIDFCQVIWFYECPHISLRRDISFKEFSQYKPNITRRQLTKLFDYCDDNTDLFEEAFNLLIERREREDDIKEELARREN